MSEAELREREAERNLADNLRRLEQFRPIDDTFMRAMFKDNKELGEFVLRIIMRKPDLKLVSFNTQVDLKRVTGARGVCFDAGATDDEGTKYDIEVQCAPEGADPHRVRYHSSVMDVENLHAGQDFSELPDTYVIFITETDVFGKGEPYYVIQNMNITTGEPFNDGAYIIYVNGAYEGDDDIGRLMHDFKCSNPKEMNYPIMADTAQYLKENPKGVKHMCKIMDDLRIESELRGEIRGRKEGIQAGADMLGRLIDKLMKSGEVEKVAVAANNAAEREKMYKEYGIA